MSHTFQFSTFFKGPFIGQIQCFGFNFTSRGWALCNGQIMSIAQNTALFSLLGTMYGGEEVSTTFTLLNLQGRAPIHFSQAAVTHLRGKYRKPLSTITNCLSMRTRLYRYQYSQAIGMGVAILLSAE
ncbi:phage tail protein [Spirosoma pulveris]